MVIHKHSALFKGTASKNVDLGKYNISSVPPISCLRRKKYSITITG